MIFSRRTWQICGTDWKNRNKGLYFLRLKLRLSFKQDFRRQQAQPQGRRIKRFVETWKLQVVVSI